jgi:hypothetical protein
MPTMANRFISPLALSLSSREVIIKTRISTNAVYISYFISENALLCVLRNDIKDAASPPLAFIDNNKGA